LGFPTGRSFTSTPHRNQTVSGAVAGEKEDFCKGSFARISFTLFIVLLYFILLASFYQKQKKLVSTIVVIFVGLFIMLSINGWFL
jgi:hypothetical protein